MYGAVLWSDRCNNRALIWCEDQGNLAFFDGETDEDACASGFDEGDLVSFKVRDGRGMRLAFEVEVVSSEEYPYLADGLREASQNEPRLASPQPETHERKILAFNPDRSSQKPRRSDAPAQRPQSDAAILQLR